MPRIRQDRLYLEAWLRRLSREMSASGALTQAAHRLAQDLGGSTESWKSRLGDILNGTEKPSIDLVTRIDALWSMTAKPPAQADSQGTLF